MRAAQKGFSYRVDDLRPLGEDGKPVSRPRRPIGFRQPGFKPRDERSCEHGRGWGQGCRACRGEP